MSFIPVNGKEDSIIVKYLILPVSFEMADCEGLK
jgi:hypothetical protein